LNSRSFFKRTWLCFIAIGAILCVAGVSYLGATAAPIRPLAAVQPFGDRISPDTQTVRRMVRRAQLDYLVRPAPEVPRTLLYLCEARSDGNEFDLVFDPAGQLDIFVSYRFSRDGKMLWKQAHG
jgi:hypothetical protein